jgi:hypothetical protein
LTGQPIHQIVQTKHDPITGETSKVVSPMPKNNMATGLPTQGPSQIVTVTDPNTGQLVQQLVQTQIDPLTGETKQVMSPLPAGASGAFNGGQAGGGAVQVITVQDPVTGQFQQQVVSCSGSMNGGVQGAPTTTVTVTDPITGQPVQQVVQTIIDPTTGETSQIPISNLGIVLNFVISVLSC